MELRWTSRRAVFKEWDAEDEIFANFSGEPALDILEIFGGAMGVSKVAVRRKLRTGKCQDLATGVDLTIHRQQRALYNYVAKYKPLFIVGGPPCGSTGALLKINSVMNLGIFPEQQKHGEKLVRVMRIMMSMQL